MIRFSQNLLLSFIICILFTIPAEALTKKESSNGFTVTTIDNATRNGLTGFLFKIAMNVPGPDTSGAFLIVNFCDINGKKIYVNGKELWAFGSITLPFTSNRFDNCELFISHKDLKKGNLTPSSMFKYFFTVSSKGQKGTLKQSGFFTWGSNTQTNSYNRNNRINSNKSNNSNTANMSRKSATYNLSVGFGNPKYGGGQWVGEGKNAKTFMIDYDSKTLRWNNPNNRRLNGKVFQYSKTLNDGTRVYVFNEVIGEKPLQIASRYEFGISADGKDLKFAGYTNNEYAFIEFGTTDSNKLRTEIAKYRNGVTPVRIMSPESGNSRTESAGPASSGKRRCPGCNGTGHQKERINQSDPYAITGKSARYYCEKCGGWFATKHNHYTPTCPVCHGKGYVD